MILEKAIEIALSAHKNQVDKAGQPYILHPLRVMLQMDTEVEQIVAVLHDVLEDSDLSSLSLRERGASQEILTVLDHLTHRKSESYAEFILRVMQNPIAKKIKLADLWDNMDLRRLPEATEEDFAMYRKYEKAYKLLNGGAG
ncbi:MAG: GTP pyrophosphokinase [Syntrophobacteraceae bacterium]|jgi:(p)ppGpp synthase/HD superfamily hydrolase